MSQSHGNDDYICFSVAQSALEDAENHINHDATLNVLQEVYRMDVTITEGVYQGVAERSFIVNACHEKVVKQLCDLFKQECYMLCKTHKHGLRKAYFVYPDGTEEFQGYLREVSQETAEASEGFTYRPDLHKFWIIDVDDSTQIGQGNA